MMMVAGNSSRIKVSPTPEEDDTSEPHLELDGIKISKPFEVDDSFESTCVKHTIHPLKDDGIFSRVSNLLEKENMNIFILCVNVFWMLTAVWIICFVDQYFNEKAIAANAEDLMSHACERMVQAVDEVFSRPTVINEINTRALLRGDVVVPLTAGNITNQNDFLLVSHLTAHDDAVAYSFLASESGYFLGAARRDNNEKIVIVAKEVGSCRRREFEVTNDGFRIWESVPDHRVLDVSEERCRNLSPSLASRENKVLCRMYPDECDYYGDTYTGCGTDGEDASGYRWEFDSTNSRYKCRQYEVYDHREKSWFREALLAEPGEITWSSAYSDVATGNITVTALKTVEVQISNHTERVVLGVDVSIDGVSEILTRSNILKSLPDDGQNFVFEYQSEDSSRRGLLWGSADVALRHHLANGTLINVLDETATSKDSTDTFYVDLPPLILSAVSRLSSNFLERDSEGTYTGHNGDPRYVTRADDIVTSGDSVICAAALDSRVKSQGVAVIAVNRSVFINEYEGVRVAFLVSCCVISSILFWFGSSAFKNANDRNTGTAQVCSEPSTPKQDFSLGVVVYLSLVTVAAVAATHQYMAAVGDDTVSEGTSEISSEVNIRVGLSLQEMLRTPSHILSLYESSLNQWSTNNNVSSGNDTSLFSQTCSYYSDMLDIYANSRTPMSLLYFGDSVGNLMGMSQYDNEKLLWIKEFSDSTQQYCFHAYVAVTDDLCGNNTLRDARCPYEAREQQWYVSASENQKMTFSSIYFLISDHYGLSTGRRFYLQDIAGSNEHVLSNVSFTAAVDFTLEQLSTYLWTEKEYSIFILEPYGQAETSGSVVANTAGKVEAMWMKKPVRLYANETDDDVTEAVTSYMKLKYDDGEYPWGSEIIGYGLTRSFVSISGLREFGWDSAVAIPRYLVMSDFDDFNALSVIFMLGVVLVTLIAGRSMTLLHIIWRESREKYKPVSVKVGKVDPPLAVPDLDGPAKELHELHALKETIRSLLGRLPGTVRLIKGKKYVVTDEDLRRHLRRGDRIKIGASYFTVDAYDPFTATRLPLDREYDHNTFGAVGCYKRTLLLDDSDHVAAKRYILDSTQRGRSVVDILRMENAKQFYRLKGYYIVTNWYYSALVVSVLLALHLLGFMEAPTDSIDIDRDVMLTIEGSLLLILIFDVCVTILITGFRTVKSTGATSLRYRTIIRAATTTLISIDWLFRFLSEDPYETGGDFNTYLPYSSTLRPMLLVAQNDHLASSFSNFFKTLIFAQDVVVVFLCFLCMGASMGITLFQGTYDNSDEIGRGYDDFRSAYYVMFIFLGTGDNYSSLVFPAAHEHGVYKLYYMVFFFVGQFLLVAIIIALFQEKYMDNYEKVVHKNKLRRYEGLIAAFVLLDANESDDLSPEEHQDFFMNTCRCGASCGLLKQVDFTLRDWVVTGEQLVSLFDSAPPFYRQQWAAYTIQRAWRLHLIRSAGRTTSSSILPSSSRPPTSADPGALASGAEIRGSQSNDVLQVEPCTHTPPHSSQHTQAPQVQQQHSRLQHRHEQSLVFPPAARFLLGSQSLRRANKIRSLMWMPPILQKMKPTIRNTVLYLRRFRFFRRVHYALVTGMPAFPRLKSYMNASWAHTLIQVIVCAQVWLACMLTTPFESYVGYVFAILQSFQAVEFFLKILSYGTKGYFRHPDPNDPYDLPARRFDCGVLIVTVGLFLAERIMAGTMRVSLDQSLLSFAIPTVRVFSVIKSARRLIFGLFTILLGLSYLFLFFLVVIYSFATVGVMLFAGDLENMPVAQYSLPDANFDSMNDAMTTLFQMMPAVSWSTIMYALIDAKGTFVAGLYSVVYTIVVPILFTNLFVGVVCDGFHTLQQRRTVDESGENAIRRIALKAQLFKGENTPNSAREELDPSVVGVEIDSHNDDDNEAAQSRGFETAAECDRLTSFVYELRRRLFEVTFSRVVGSLRGTRVLPDIDVDDAFALACSESVLPRQYETWIRQFRTRAILSGYGHKGSAESARPRGSHDDHPGGVESNGFCHDHVNEGRVHRVSIPLSTREAQPIRGGQRRLVPPTHQHYHPRRANQRYRSPRNHQEPRLYSAEQNLSDHQHLTLHARRKTNLRGNGSCETGTLRSTSSPLGWEPTDHDSNQIPGRLCSRRSWRSRRPVGHVSSPQGTASAGGPRPVKWAFGSSTRSLNSVPAESRDGRP
eukprot:Rmarinus@m.22562